MISISLNASIFNKSDKDQEISHHNNLDIEISYINSNKYNELKNISDLSDNYFNSLEGQNLSKDSTYWIKIKITNNSKRFDKYILHFNNTIAKIESFQIKKDSLFDYQLSGCLIPYNIRTNKAYMKDQINLNLPYKSQEIIFLKIENQLNYTNTSKYLSISPQKEIESYIESKNLSSGIFLGFIGLLIVFAFILLLFSHDSLYLIYGLYMMFIAAYFGSALNITEQIFFQKLPLLDIYLQWGLYISQNLYFLFLIRILKKENLEKKAKKLYKVLYFTIPLIISIFIISLYDYNLARLLHYYYTIMFIIIAIGLFFMSYRIVKLPVKLILIGTFSMVFGALISAFVANPKYPGLFYSSMIYYQSGVLIEFILFMIAILYTFFNEIKLKHYLEKKQLEIQIEKLQKEKENILLKQKVDKTYRELASTSIKLSQKESIITELMQKLSHLKNDNTNDKELNSLISVLKQHLNNNSWTEFEYYFNQVHPKFYSDLLKKFPELTVNEKKICAYLKLNLNTKEIASVSGKSINSIEVARTRLRKKLGLEPYQNIYNFIASI